MDNSKWGCGAIIQDEAGDFTAAIVTGAEGAKSVLELEARVVLEGIKLVTEMGIDRVVVESDSQLLMQYLSSSTPPISNIGSVLSDIKKISLQFRAILYSFVSKETNKVAHRLAKFGVSLNSPRRWLEYAPSFIVDVIVEDSFD